MAEELARRAAAAIGNAQLYRTVQLREQDLRISEERFRSAFEQAAVGMAHLDVNGNYLRVNNRLCEILGYSREELLQKSFMEVTHPDDLAVDLAQTERQIRGELIHHSMEKRYIRRDGSTLWANMTASVVRDEAGAPKYGIVVIEDISDRRAAEEERARLTAQIAMEQQRLAVILEHLPAGVLIADASGELVLSNPEVERIFAHPFRATTEMSGYQAWQLFDPQTGAEFPLERMPMVRTLTTGETVVGEEMKLRRGDGTWGFASVNSAPVRDINGNIVLGVSAFIDITARRQAEEELRRLNLTLEERIAERTAELERSNRDLDQFAYVASHDLKAPLRGIDSLATWISEDAAEALPPASREHLGKLRARVGRMERLLEDLLTYSRIGRRDGQAETVETAALVSDIVDLLAVPVGFTVTIAPDLPVLYTPRAPLELVFRNLIGNAVKHHHQPATGHIWIAARDLGELVEFRIRDDGPGIAAQHHQRIFNMFQTLRPRDEVEGSGMGLAIVQRAVEYRQGAIWVESAPGEGAVFIFTWPKSS
jgi:PAS domain S-box-containing protein